MALLVLGSMCSLIIVLKTGSLGWYINIRTCKQLSIVLSKMWIGLNTEPKIYAYAVNMVTS